MIHKVGATSQTGQVSALCYHRPRPIRSIDEGWTRDASEVTCEKCLRALLAGAPRTTGRQESCPE